MSDEKVTLWKHSLLGDLGDDELREAVGFVLTCRDQVTDEQAREVYAEAKWRKLYDDRPIAPDDPLLVVDAAVKKALGLKITITTEIEVADALDNWFVNTPEGSYVFLDMMGYNMESEPDFRGCFGSKTVRVDEIREQVHLCEQINCPASLGTGECVEDPDFPLRRRESPDDNEKA